MNLEIHVLQLAIYQQFFEFLKGPIKRITVPDIAIPYSPPLEKEVIPNPEKIETIVSDLISKGR